MKFRIISDIHAEFTKYSLVELPDDSNTVLIIAGDCFLFKKHTEYAEFLKYNASRFKHVVIVPGNHEYYKTNIYNGSKKLRADLVGINNVSILEKDTFIIDDFAIIGATLWADFDRDELTRIRAQSIMNDYKQIRHGTKAEPWLKKLHSLDTLALHFEHKTYIFNEIKKHKANGLKTIVVSHHAPSYMSISPDFIGDSTNGAYVSNLSEEILDTAPMLWVHGHVHNNFDYMIGSTRVVCNPRGYVHSIYGAENHSFNAIFTVDL